MQMKLYDDDYYFSWNTQLTLIKRIDYILFICSFMLGFFVVVVARILFSLVHIFQKTIFKNKKIFLLLWIIRIFLSSHHCRPPIKDFWFTWELIICWWEVVHMKSLIYIYIWDSILGAPVTLQNYAEETVKKLYLWLVA